MFNKDQLSNIYSEFLRSNLIVERSDAKDINSKELASFIDHTLLKPDASSSEIINLCKEAHKSGFASVCVNPCNVEICTKELFGSTVKVCTVVGFPLGANEIATKIDETELAISSGAAEIDMVLNIGRLKDHNQEYIITEITSLADLCHKNNVLLKVIIETALLTDLEKVLASLLVLEGNADFVKTSTGFSKGGATLHDVALMKYIVGNNAKVKAAGGIRSYEDAILMILNGASRLGTSSGIQIIEKSTSSSVY
jgi:deoxyribose-phosphate aldolase